MFVTVVAGVVSILLPSSTIAVMGLVGGYLVPLVAGRSSDSPTALCAYLLTLNVGAFVVARGRQWPILDFLATAFAYVAAFAWCGQHAAASVQTLLVVFVFLTLVHALYLASVVRGAAKFTSAGRSLSWALIAVATNEAEIRTRQEILGTLSAFILVVAAVVGLFGLVPNMSRWFPVASEKVAAIDLPGERFHGLTVTFSREVREKCLRVVVENGDNPVLQYEDVPLSVLSPIYDAAFVAQPGVHYEVGFVDAAAVPRYDDVVLSYIERVRDPKVLRIDLPAAKAFRLSSGSSSVNWLGEHLLLVAYVLAFLVLLAVRLLLFRVKPCV